MGAILLLLFLRLHIVVRVRIGYFCSLTKKEPLLNGKEEGSASASASSAAALPSSLPMPFMMKTQSGKLAEVIVDCSGYERKNLTDTVIALKKAFRLHSNVR